MGKFLVATYLLAIVAADLIITKMGPSGLIITGLFLIPFDLISRDQLQDMWRGKSLKLKMLGLVGSGSLIAYLINPESRQIALASGISFAIAGTVDYAVYSILIDKKKIVKMNVSNILASLADSVCFQIIAFGNLNYYIAAGQSGLKITGGYLWSILFIWSLKKWNDMSQQRLKQ